MTITTAATTGRPPRARLRILSAWILIALSLCGLAMGLAAASPEFDYAVPLSDKPSLLLAGGLMVAGLLYALLIPLAEQTERCGLGQGRSVLAVIVVGGLAMRLTAFGSIPALEDDWYRYLWDGAVTAHGYNPFAVSPDDAQGNDHAGGLQTVAEQSGVIIERINHSDLKTIYPPLAQAVFALAHLIAPWNLEAWRLVCLLAECLTLTLLLLLLARSGRTQVWAALYWWNPIVIKELANTAHMEAVLMPAVVAAVLLAITGRRILATGLLGIAAAVKLWPLILAPIVLRPLWGDSRRLVAALGLLAILLCAAALPPLLGGLDETSGFRAYATYWQTNSAAFPVIHDVVSWILAPCGLSPETVARSARGVVAAVLLSIVFVLAWPPVRSTRDETWRLTVAVTALLLLSPAQFPWYLVWVLPFACLHPWRGFVAATIFMPLYYVSFHYLAADRYEDFTTCVVWLIWVPVWIAFAWDALAARTTHEVSRA